MKYRQTIIIEYDIIEGAVMDESDIEYALGGSVNFVHTQKQKDGKWLYDDMGRYIAEELEK